MNNLKTSSTSTDINPELRTFVKALFEQMLLDFGKKFTDQWSSVDPEKMEEWWCRNLTGFTRREFKRGLLAMEKLAWPPTLPEFKKLCRIDSLNAYYEALEGIQAREKGEVGVWSHPAVFWAAMPLSFDLKHKSFTDMRLRWEKALNDEFDKGQWEPIPQPMKMLEYNRSDDSAEKAQAFLKSVGMEKFGKNKSALEWAYKILANEKNYPAMSVVFAKEAISAYQKGNNNE
jgi:hypothetical protein